ncbi:MAG: pyridoxine 4-dehydrogenase [Verrucomicrobiota bacterium]|nr:pyridoxine 4-dehydrogenase [Verrucomicrobiota bacterium]
MQVPLTFRFNDGTEVRRLGYGAMRLTGQPGNFGPYEPWDAGKLVLRRALDLGINFIDTARAYGPGWNEKLVAEALHPYPEGLFIATKGGVVKKSATERHLDGTPNGLRRDCEESLKILRVDCIELYQLHWVDPDVPLSESVTGLARLQQEGKIRLIGLSNITVEQLEEVRSIAQIASVQNRYSVGEKQGDSMVAFCEREGVAFVPYGPLGADPMKQGAPLASAAGALAEIGKELGVTTTQVALSWLLHRAPNILPIPGTTSIAHLQENVASASLSLTPEQLQQLESDVGLTS